MDDAEEQGTVGPDATLANLKKEVSDLEPVTSGTLGREERGRAAILDAQATGLTSLHRLRERWSPFLMVLLAVTTAFQIVLVVSVGAGWLPFKGHEVFANTVASELFFQIAGMGYVVVRCLFPSDEAKKPKSPAKRSDKLKP